MDSIRNKFNSVSKKMVAVIATVLLSLTCGVGIVLAAAGGGGSEIDPSGPAGTQFRHFSTWYDVPKHDASGWHDDEPNQGWDGDSVEFFWNHVNESMGEMNGLRLDAGTTANYQKQKFEEACYQALARCKTRDNQKARIVAVSVFYSNSSAQGGNVALLAQYNENKYRNFFAEPGDDSLLWEEQGNHLDKDHGWWEPCEQPDALPGENWTHYMWRITGVDTCGGVDNNAPYSVIAIAINEDMMAGQNITLEKHITGEDAKDGTLDKLLYEATQGNSDCYDLSGAKFQVFKEDGVTPVEARVRDSNGKLTDEKVPVVFTTNSDGSTDEIYTVKNGEYWLRETQAPNKGYYKDEDGDGIRDELDKSPSLGKKVTIKGKKVTVDGVELQSVGKIDGKDLFAFTWFDPPMNDPQPIYLQKRDAITGGVTQMPEGEGDTNGAKYRFAYFKGIYTQVSQLPGYDKTTGKVDWNYADTTALWRTQTFVDASGVKWSGYIFFNLDDPVEGVWKYKTSLQNYCPMGTLAIVEETPPEGYLIDDRIYLYSIADDGTHMQSNINHIPWNKDGSNGTTDRDWNNFANDYELNGDRDDVSTPWQN